MFENGKNSGWVESPAPPQTLGRADITPLRQSGSPGPEEPRTPSPDTVRGTLRPPKKWVAFSLLSSDRGQEAPQVKERPFPGGPHTLIPTCPSLTASDQLQDRKILSMTLSNLATLKTLRPGELPFQSQRNRLGGLPAGRPCRGRRTGRQRLLEPPPPRNSQGHLRGAFLERGFREPAPPRPRPPL